MIKMKLCDDWGIFVNLTVAWILLPP